MFEKHLNRTSPRLAARRGGGRVALGLCNGRYVGAWTGVELEPS